MQDFIQNSKYAGMRRHKIGAEQRETRETRQ